MIRSYTGGGQLQPDWRHVVSFSVGDRILDIMLTGMRTTYSILDLCRDKFIRISIIVKEYVLFPSAAPCCAVATV